VRYVSKAERRRWGFDHDGMTLSSYKTQYLIPFQEFLAFLALLIPSSWHSCAADPSAHSDPEIMKAMNNPKVMQVICRLLHSPAPVNAL
jgi:hypothetical protein